MMRFFETCYFHSTLVYGFSSKALIVVKLQLVIALFSCIQFGIWKTFFSHLDVVLRLSILEKWTQRSILLNNSGGIMIWANFFVSSCLGSLPEDGVLQVLPICVRQRASIL